MATPLMLAQLNGTLATVTPDGPAAGTASGALRWRPGHRAGTQAAFVEEGTTNLTANPAWGLYVAPWTATGGAGSGRKTTEWKHHGPASWKLVGSGAASCVLYYNGTFPATPHTASAVVFNDASSARDFDIRYNGTSPGGAVTLAAGEVGQVSAPFTGTGTSVAVGVRPTTAPGADVAHYIGHFQVEAKDHATSPCPELNPDGSLKAGYSWTGPEHNSASTRAATTLMLPCEAPASVACRYSEDGGETWQVGYLETLGALGTYGSITHDGTNLVISSGRSLLVGPVFAFGTALSADEQATLAGAETWTFQMVSEPNGYLDVLPVAGKNPTAPVVLT